ncbi:MAG TPA: glycosyltransferase family 2 protein [Flavisolibacter sp.]|nr:glycosyltransferase family 2 protein [Flavisolibacter sp.]
MSHPQFSIILATYNAGKTIERCISCISNQTFKDFEFIIIDGGSTDGTKAIVDMNKDIVDYYISEPDKGIYDAWNKGVKRTRGEWVMFIGSDDYLLPDALSSYHKFLMSRDISKCLYISSKIEIISNSGIKKRIYGWPWSWKEFKYKHMVAHPGSLHKRLLFERFGPYDTTYKIAGDYELLLRPKENLHALFFDRIVLKMTEGGVSSNVKTVIETRKAQINNKVSSIYKINFEFLNRIFKFFIKQAALKLHLNIYLRKEFTR